MVVRVELLLTAVPRLDACLYTERGTPVFTALDSPHTKVLAVVGTDGNQNYC